MILFIEDTRKIGFTGLAFTMVALCASIYFGWPPQPVGIVAWLGMTSVALFYLYLIAIHRRRVISIVGDRLIWNTCSLTAAPLSVPVSQIRRYQLKGGFDSHLDTGTVFSATGVAYRTGNLPRAVHRRIYNELRRFNHAIVWEES